MTTNRLVYASPVTITCAMDAIATAASRQSTVVSNATNLYLDCLVQLQLFITTGTLAAAPAVFVYAYALGYGTGYTDGCTGTDGSYTLPSPTNLKLAQIIPYTLAVNTSTIYSSPFSVAACFGGILPSAWGIVINNLTGCTLAGTAGGQVSNTATYTGINVTNA
jgi:hypothetical protein